MKTIKLTRTIRREIDGVFVIIGPDGITFRQKRSKHIFPISWKQIWTQALLRAVAEERENLKPVLEVKPVTEDLKQIPMFTESPFDEGVECEDVPACDQEYPQSSEPEPDEGACFAYLHRKGAFDPAKVAGLD